MSHLFESGFFVREPAWHGLGDVIDEWPGSWEEAAPLAGLDWEPVDQPIYVRSTEKKHGRYSFTELEGHKALQRSDNGFVLATVTSKYATILNRTMGDIVEALLDGISTIRFDTMGSLDQGRKVWALAYLDEPFTVPGDPSASYPYIAVMNHHDGLGSCKAVNTSVRIVCANTWAMSDAEGNRSGRQFTFRHTGDVASRIEDAKQAIQGLRTDTAAWVELATQLSLMKIEPKHVDIFLSEFIPMPPAGLVSDKVVANVEAARKTFRDLLAGPTCDQINNTAYGLVQASGEYLDHLRTYRSSRTYLNRTLLMPEPLKAKAVKLAREVVNA